MNYGTANSDTNLISYEGNPATSFNFTELSKTWLLDSRLEAVMLLSVVLNGMAAGIIFIFSNTIMPTLATLDSNVGADVMNKLNIIIVNPLFIIAFFGGLCSTYPAAVMWKSPDKFSKPARYYAVATTLVFFFGEVMVTVTQNVPRNNALLAVDPESDEGVTYWTNNFLKGWVAWNTVRCVFSVIAAALGGLSLSFMRKPTVRTVSV